MKRPLGFVFILIGVAGMGYGIVTALGELVGMYRGVLNDPMRDPDGGEKAVSSRMMQGVITGAVGAVPFVIGVAMVKSSMRRRR
jgi:hypothetical protein